MSNKMVRTPFTMNERGLQYLVRRSPPVFAINGYNHKNTTWDEVRLLLVGAGGIGSELLHTLALSGFTDITIVDMDTIELSNLNRQFLFRETDIGKSKAEVAAAFVERRCPGVKVRAIFGRIEDQSDEFYLQFHAVILGVDSVSARRWMNQKIAELAEWNIVDVISDDSIPTTKTFNTNISSNKNKLSYKWKERRITSAIPLIDTGTEGYEGCCRVILLGNTSPTPCIECHLSLYPQRKTVPLCTLENIPRSTEHCVLYVQFRLWDEHHPGETLDTDNLEHIKWICTMAQKRKESFNIDGPDIDESFTLGVVKNVVPAVGFTNALVAGQAVIELLKLLTGIGPSMQCFSYFNGAAECGGLTSYITNLSPNPICPVCAPRPILILKTYMKPCDVLHALAQRCGISSLGEQLDVTLRVRFNNNGEVYLLYRTNNPLRTNVEGNTIEEIFTFVGQESAFVLWCSEKDVTFTVECSGAEIFISAEALMLRE